MFYKWESRFIEVVFCLRLLEKLRIKFREGLVFEVIFFLE